MSETLQTQVRTFIKYVYRKGTKETITVAMPRVPVYRPEIAPGHSNTNCMYIPLLLPGSTTSYACALKGQSVAI
jgi:hypothetical protein